MIEHRACHHQNLIWFLLFLFSLNLDLSAQNYSLNCLYVNCNHPAASDSNPGTVDFPWRTISHAFDMALPGDSVIIREGVYLESLITSRGGNTTQGPVVFSAFPGDSVRIDGLGNSNSTGIRIYHDHVRLYGLTVGNWPSTGIWVSGAAFFEIHTCVVHDVYFGIGISGNSHDFLIKDTEIHHFTLYGADVSPNGTDFCYNGRFVGCVAHTCRDPEQNVDGFALGHGQQYGFSFENCIAYGVYDGFDISASSTDLKGCLAHHCSNTGFKLWGNQVELINCIARNCTVSAVQVCWNGNPTTTTLKNCTFYGTDVYTIWMQNSSSTLNIYNSIIAAGNNIGLCFEQPSAGNYHGDHNLFQNNNSLRAINVGWTDEFSLAEISQGAWSTFSGEDEHSLVADSVTTIFQNPVSGNLRLLPSSPAMNAASDSWSPGDDFEGLLRPCGSAPDIGAYELQTGGYHANGNVSGVWQLQDTIYVDGDLVVPLGQNLTIEAATGGTRIIFNGPYAVVVYGKIVLNGSASDSITLTAANPDSGWHGLRFFHTSATIQDSSHIKYCSFLNANNLLRDDGTGGAIFALNSSNLVVEHCLFTRNRAIHGGAVGLDNSQPDLSDLTLLSNEASKGGGMYISGNGDNSTAGLLYANEIHYLGAFRLPDVTTQSTWGYSGSASAFRADGDPSGPADGFPGSIIASGHDWYFDIGEISIPVPVISADKDPEDLNTAGMKQPLTNITNGFFDTVATEMLRTGLAWLPPQGAQQGGKLYMCIGQHYQFSQYVSHIWCNDDLSSPETAGPWYFGDEDNYRTNDYMFTVPDAFANQHLGGRKLITGRYRDGGWSGKGPNLYAFAPWTEGNPPAPLSTLENIVHLVGYNDTDSLDGYKNADEWIGGAWMEFDGRSAVAVLGTKALGDCWYGFANGVTFPNDSNYFPPWPYDIRGWWADDFEARILFYDPGDMAAVAAGNLQPWEIQPYDSLAIENLLFNPFHDFGRDQLGSCAYDSENRLLYVFERLADGDKSLVHVFRAGNDTDQMALTVTPVMERIEMISNSAGDAGGGLFIKDCSPAFLNLKLSGNSAVNQGGAVKMAGVTSSTLQNLLAHGNSASLGAAVFLERIDGQPQLINATMSDNLALVAGGAVYCDSASPLIRNSISWGNSAGNQNQEIFLNDTSSDPIVRYSDISGGAAGFGGVGAGSQYDPARYVNNIDLNPLFEDGIGNYRTKGNSPCRDAGDPADTVAFSNLSDLDGLPRIHASAVDMGCYEFQGIPAYVTVGNFLALSGSDTCFAAAKILTLAGGETSIVIQPGSLVLFEAGAAIEIYESLMVQHGAAALFRIEPSGNYCQLTPGIPVNPEMTFSQDVKDLPEETLAATQLIIRPNPSQGLITISWPVPEGCIESVITIVTSRGIVARQEKVQGMGRFQANISHYPPGVYLIRISACGTVCSEKVIKINF